MKRRRRCEGFASLALLLAAAAMLDATCLSASPIVVKPLSATYALPAALQVLVSYLLGPGVALVPGSVQYTGTPSASGIFVNGSNGDPNTSVGIANGVVLTTGDARFVSGSVAFAEDLPN